MGQFKPMVKMETTEPSVELKLAKGGAVKMKKGGSTTKAKKMAMGGGAMDMMSGTPALVGRPAVNAPVRTPGKPSMMARRKAMMAKPAMTPSSPAMPTMKKGGKAEGGDTAQDKAMIKKAFKQHDMQEHKGGKGTNLKLKKGGKMATGGVTDGQGGYKTGGVVLGNGGGYKTGGVALGNAGGYKMGGKTSKKAYATGGTVNSGKPVAMPQGAKKPTPPVSINRLSGTFKKGGTVKMNGGGASSNKGIDMSKGAYDASKKHSMELEEALNPLSMVKELYGKARDAFRGQGSMSASESNAMQRMKEDAKQSGTGAMNTQKLRDAMMKSGRSQRDIDSLMSGQGAVTETAAPRVNSAATKVSAAYIAGMKKEESLAYLQ